jgi:hypothetical protein
MKRKNAILAMIVSLCCLMWPEQVSAQNRSGFWFALGGGYGSAAVNCDDCGDEEREGGGTGFIRTGWTLNPRILIGAEFQLWTKDDTSDPDFSARLNVSNFSGTITLYPSETSGFFVKAGAGVSMINLELKSEGDTFTSEGGRGLGLVAGAGFDIPLGRRIAITPAVDFAYGRPGTVQILGLPFGENFRQNVLSASIGITFP